MTPKQIREYLQQRLKNIIWNLEGAKTEKEKIWYTAQKEEVQSIIKSIKID